MNFCRSKFGKFLNSVNIYEPEKRYELNCKSWRCPVCRVKWSRKWGSCIADELENAPENSLLLVNLTTAEMTDHKAIEAALRWFMRRMRSIYGGIEYVKVVEYNRLQTQPHFHLILRFDSYIVPVTPPGLDKKLSYPGNMFEVIKSLWSEALSFAIPENKLTKVVWCQPPGGRGAAAAKYAVGYIAGGGGHKDYELPNETWRGRRITYSRGFFRGRTVSSIWSGIIAKWFRLTPKDLAKKVEFILIPKKEYQTTFGLNHTEFLDLHRILTNPDIIRNSIIYSYLTVPPPDLVIKWTDLYTQSLIVVDKF